MKKAYASPKSREKAEAAWIVALRLQQFGYAEISSEMTIPIEFATHIVQTWNRDGRIRVITPHVGSGRMLFEVVPAHELRIVAAQGDAHDQMWTAMRKLGSFSPVDIAAHCAADVSLEDARAYCRMLLAAGYMRVVSKAVPGKKEAIYRLFRITGVQAPREKRIRCIVDENLGTATPLSGVAQ